METVTEQIPTVAQEQVSQPQIPQEQNVPNKRINKVYLLAGLVLVVFLLAGGAFAYTTFLSPKTTSPNNAGLNSYYNNQKQVQKKVENSTITDTSDAQIDKDLQSINESLSNMDANAAAVDQGLNDQQINLQ